MSSRKEYIEILRQVLVKTNFELKTDEEYDWPTYDKFMETLLTIENEKIYELVPELYVLLGHASEGVREEVVLLLGLGTRLHVPEFKERAFQIWLNDESESVKHAALTSWSSYYLGTKNPEALKILYSILMNEQYLVKFRSNAMQKLFFVSQEPSKFYDPLGSDKFFDPNLTHEELNALIDWKEIEGIMRKYAPEVFN